MSNEKEKKRLNAAFVKHCELHGIGALMAKDYVYHAFRAGFYTERTDRKGLYQMLFIFVLFFGLMLYALIQEENKVMDLQAERNDCWAIVHKDAGVKVKIK